MMAQVARGLAASFRVLEPFQRPSGPEPLTVATHIADLRELIEASREAAPPALVGASWGAMLALAFAAAHPDLAGPLVLIGCGTFDPVSRASLHAVLDERKRAGVPLYDCDPLPLEPEPSEFDARAHEETWNDMLRAQKDGLYPAAFSAILSPVLMLHGAFDPHPGPMIRDNLLPFLPQLEYREWERCGHEPWRERGVSEEFFQVLGSWLAARCG